MIGRNMDNKVVMTTQCRKCGRRIDSELPIDYDNVDFAVENMMDDAINKLEQCPCGNGGTITDFWVTNIVWVS